MAENIVLAKFGIDTADVMKETMELKKNIDDLKVELKEYQKAEGNTTQKQIETEVALKALNQQYQQNMKVLQAVATEQRINMTLDEKATQLLNNQATSIEGLRLQNAELNKVRNSLDINTQAELIKQLNEKIDQNTNTIRVNADSMTQQKMNIGNYADSIQAAMGNLSAFGVQVPGSLNSVTQAMQAMGMGGAALGAQLKGAMTAIMGLTRASLAFIATPIGAVIAVLATAFIAVKTAISRSEESLDKLTIAFAPLTGLVELLMDALGELGGAVIDVLIMQFENLQKAATAVIEGITLALDKLGFDDAAKSVQGYADSMANAGQKARELAIAEDELEDLHRANLVAVEKLKTQSSELKEIRDDTSRSLEERTAAAVKVQEIEAEMIRVKLIEAQKEFDMNQKLIAQKGATNTLLDQQAQLEAKIIGIKGEQAELDRSSNKKLNAIRDQATAAEKAAADKAAADAQKRRDDAARAQQKAIDDRLKGLSEEIAYEKESFGWRAKTLQQELVDIETLNKKQKFYLDEQLKYGKMNRTQYNTEILKLDQERAKKQAEISVETAQLELQAVQRTQAEIQKQEGYLSEQKLTTIRKSNQAVLNERIAFEKTRLEQGLISETQYNAAIFQHQQAMNDANDAPEKEREQNRKDEAAAQRALDFELELELMQQQGATKFELERMMLQEQNDIKQQLLDDQLAKGLISQEQFNLQSLRLSKELKDAETKIEQAKVQMKLNLTKGLLTAIGSQIDAASGAGKAIALAQAGINMYEGITADLKLGWPMNAIAIAKDTITGMAAIRNIMNTKIPSATGSGSVGGGGSMPSGIGSTNLRYDTETDATTMRQLQANDLIDMDSVGNAVADGARRGTAQGMTDLTDNRQIANGSTF